VARRRITSRRARHRRCLPDAARLPVQARQAQAPRAVALQPVALQPVALQALQVIQGFPVVAVRAPRAVPDLQRPEAVPPAAVAAVAAVADLAPRLTGRRASSKRYVPATLPAPGSPRSASA
jgi:hypothetical protein